MELGRREQLSLLTPFPGSAYDYVDVCGFAVRSYTAMYECMYDDMKDKCNATAAAVYTEYRSTHHSSWLATMNCSISE